MCNLTKGYVSNTPFRFLKCIWCDREDEHQDTLWPFSWVTPTLDQKILADMDLEPGAPENGKWVPIFRG